MDSARSWTDAIVPYSRTPRGRFANRKVRPTTWTKPKDTKVDSPRDFEVVSCPQAVPDPADFRRPLSIAPARWMSVAHNGGLRIVDRALRDAEDSSTKGVLRIDPGEVGVIPCAGCVDCLHPVYVTGTRGDIGVRVGGSSTGGVLHIDE